jgi:hypothetical protein
MYGTFMLHVLTLLVHLERYPRFTEIAVRNFSVPSQNVIEIDAVLPWNET